MINISNTAFFIFYNSPCGKLILASAGEKLCLCDWSESRCLERNIQSVSSCLGVEFKEGNSAILQSASRQLDEYFTGRRTTFDIPLCFAGTEFQKDVWNALLEIPYGATYSYMDIARTVGKPKGVRAVAQAIGANRMSIFVPCHRVIGTNHSLTGFAGGLEAKRFLLELESNRIFRTNNILCYMY